MNDDDSYFRPEVPVTSLLHTYRQEFGNRCQCGEREWPAELRDEEPSALPDG